MGPRPVPVGRDSLTHPFPRPLGAAIKEPDPPPPSRVDQVYARLRHAIVEGEHAPGSPLRHQELSESLGVSLIPIREALRKLEMERLVESQPNKGARVTAISESDVADVYATRIAIEQEALRKAIPNIGASDITELRRLRQEMVSLVRKDDPTFYELHRQVHYAIYERSESPWLLHMIEILWSHTERHRRIAARVKSFVDEGDDHHGRIIDAVEAGDVEKAMASLGADLERTSRLVVDAYRDASD